MMPFIDILVILGCLIVMFGTVFVVFLMFLYFLGKED